MVAANDQQLVRFQAQAPGGEFRRYQGALVGLTSVPSPRYNGVLEASFPAGTEDRRVRAVMAYVAGRRKGFGWAVGPTTRPRRLGVHLTRAGMHHLFDLRAMALDMRTPVEDVPAPAGLRIGRLMHARELPHWTGTLGAAFKNPLEEARPIAKLERALGFGERLPRQLFLGTLRGRAVATAMLFAQPPAAGIYNVGVLGRYRGRGIGTAMMRVALAEGRTRGCDF
jgi:GNAT superfamily N-acetyltransferase